MQMASLIRRIHLVGKDLQASFKNCGYVLRPTASTALWPVPLIPMAMVVGALRHSVKATDDDALSQVFFSTTIVAVGLLATTVLYIMRFIPRVGFMIRDFNTIFALPAVGTLVILLCTQNIHSHTFNDLRQGSLWFRKTCGLSRTAQIVTGFIASLVGGLASSYGVLAGLPSLLTLAPGCFTLGEAVIVVHSIVLFLYSTVVNLSRVALSHVNLLEDPTQSFQTATVILQTGLLGIFLMLSALVAVPWMRQPVPFYSLFGTVVVGILVSLHLLLNGSPVLWILQTFILHERTVKLVLFWVHCFVGSIFALYYQTRIGQKASTSFRKSFHILAVVLFVSGLLYAPDFLYLASGVFFALLIVLDTFRVLNIPPFSESLQSSFLIFKDEKDGLISLTALYLVAGCSAPLWLYPSSEIPIPRTRLLSLLGGILSVGIGDSAASIVGSKFGQHRWPGSQRTIEGTIACFLSQLISIGLLVYGDYVSADASSLFQAIAAVAIISMVEAETDQIDNLVLPLLMYLLLL